MVSHRLPLPDLVPAGATPRKRTLFPLRQQRHGLPRIVLLLLRLLSYGEGQITKSHTREGSTMSEKRIRAQPIILTRLVHSSAQPRLPSVQAGRRRGQLPQEAASAPSEALPHRKQRKNLVTGVCEARAGSKALWEREASRTWKRHQRRRHLLVISGSSTK